MIANTCQTLGMPLCMGLPQERSKCWLWWTLLDLISSFHFHRWHPARQKALVRKQSRAAGLQGSKLPGSSVPPLSRLSGRKPRSSQQPRAVTAPPPSPAHMWRFLDARQGRWERYWAAQGELKALWKGLGYCAVEATTGSFQTSPRAWEI